MSKKLSCFGYYGGKFSKLAWLLPQLNTPHHTYVEACAGSLSVMLNKPRVEREIANDSADEVITFWRVLRDEKEALIDLIMETPAGEVEFKRILSLPPSNDDVEMARRFYVITQQAFNNAIGFAGYSFVRPRNYKAARRHLRSVADRIRDVKMECADACQLIRRLIKAEKSSAKPRSFLAYVDPPYVKEVRTSVGHYIDENFDHDAFLAAVTAAPETFKFAISGYDNDLYNDALAGWHRVESGKVAVTSSKKGKFGVEVLWRNYELSNQQVLL